MVEHLKKIYRPNEKTLLACSGGPDSTALFYLLLELKKQLPDFDFQVFHLNHCLRGESAERDALFVQNLCEKNRILFYGSKEDVKSFSKNNHLSLEEAGRKIRYKKLLEIKEKQGFHSITTAHHADDQSELFLMRLFQGAGIESLTGMKERKGIFIRPLLKIRKKELLQYLEKNSLSFRTDETNSNQEFLRNKIRNRLIPVIGEIFPVYQEKIQQLQEILQRQQKFILKSLTKWKKISGQTYLQLENFNNIPEELQIEELLLGLKMLSEDYYLSTKNLENILVLLKQWNHHGHKIFLETKDFSFLGSQETLFFVEKEFLEKTEPDFMIYSGERKILDHSVIENPSMISFYIRKSNPGERIQLEKTKKLQDFLTDKKIFYHWRKKVKVIETEKKQFAGLIEPVSGKLFLRKEFQGALILTAQPCAF